MTLFGVVVFGISLSIRVCVARENEDGQREQRSGSPPRRVVGGDARGTHDACARGEREREWRRRKEVVRKDSERVRKKERQTLYVQGTVTFPTLITVNH